MTEFYNRHSEKDKRRELRSNMTAAEILLWSRLKSHQLLGARFRRQYSIGPFIVDFYCAQHKLVIEVDGDSHYVDGADIKDSARMRYIEQFGVRFLRFTNRDVLDNLNGVLEVIAGALRGR